MRLDIIDKRENYYRYKKEDPKHKSICNFLGCKDGLFAKKSGSGGNITLYRIVVVDGKERYFLLSQDVVQAVFFGQTAMESRIRDTQSEIQKSIEYLRGHGVL